MSEQNPAADPAALIADLREKHAAATPGPWRATSGHDEIDHYVRIWAGDRLICEVEISGSLEEAEANAAFIVALVDTFPAIADAFEAVVRERDEADRRCVDATLNAEANKQAAKEFDDLRLAAESTITAQAARVEELEADVEAR